MENILFYKNKCQFCDKVFIALLALKSKDRDKFKIIEKTAAQLEAKYTDHLAGKTYPCLLADGEYLSESNRIIELIGKKYQLHFRNNFFSKQEIERFVNDGCESLANSINYYYKVYFSPSSTRNHPGSNLDIEELNQRESCQKYATVIEKMLSRYPFENFAGGVVAEEDIYLYPGLINFKGAEEVCGFKLGVNTLRYIERIYTAIAILKDYIN